LRIIALASLIALATVSVPSSHVSAATPDNTLISNLITQEIPTVGITVLKPEQVVEAPAPAPAPPVQQPETPAKHVVSEKDTLSSIAKEHETTWKRLYDKNETIVSPDVIKVGQEITIPNPEEQLPERPLPVEPVVEEVPVTNSTPQAKKTTPAATAARGSSSGNLYTAGYCTWYVKNKRPDLPNNLGNADTWYTRANAQGLPTGSAPQVGAAAVQKVGMHVAYVEAVNGDGTIVISEMNHKGLYVQSTRTVPASNFLYIY
jgi:surface antigen